MRCSGERPRRPNPPQELALPARFLRRLSILLTTLLLTTGCAPTLLCTDRARGHVDTDCLQRALRPGTTLRIYRTDGGSVLGTYLRATQRGDSTVIEIDAAGPEWTPNPSPPDTVRIASTDIRKIEISERGTLMGTILFVAIGATLFAIAQAFAGLSGIGI